MRFAGTPVLDTAATATATLLRAGMIVVMAVEVENPNTVPVYLQLFDAATAGAVTLGVTVPDDTRMIPQGAGNGINTSRLMEFGRRFGLGCVYAVTTTATGATAAGTNCVINFTIQ